jgi:hypothetical protein
MGPVDRFSLKGEAQRVLANFAHTSTIPSPLKILRHLLKLRMHRQSEDYTPQRLEITEAKFLVPDQRIPV